MCSAVCVADKPVVRGKGNDLVLLTFPPRSCGGNTNCLYALQVLAAGGIPCRVGNRAGRDTMTGWDTVAHA